MAVINLETRDTIRCDNSGYCYNYSTWDSWVRWTVLAIIVVLFVLAFFFCSCITARRRRRAGQNPFYGTGWAARNDQPYYNNNPHFAPPPPQYSPNVPTGHQQYYGQPSYGQPGQQTGIELQAPQHTYAPGGSDVYQPPVGPPPTKG